jgi:hypothetical protein
MKLTRKEIKENLINSSILQSVMTYDQYNEFVMMIDTMSDSELDAFVSMAMKHTPKTEAEGINAIKKFAELNESLNSDNCAINNTKGKFTFLDEKRNNGLLSMIGKSRPSDLICIDIDADNKFKSMARDFMNSTKFDAIPADLFFGDTIPLRDFIVSVDETSKQDGYICNARIVVFDNIGCLDDMPEDREYLV